MTGGERSDVPDEWTMMVAAAIADDLTANIGLTYPPGDFTGVARSVLAALAALLAARDARVRDETLREADQAVIAALDKADLPDSFVAAAVIATRAMISDLRDGKQLVRYPVHGGGSHYEIQERQ